jgi:predicted nucleic acid-binding protein
MYLIDTNVISEVRKGKNANQGVREFWKAADTDSLYLAVQTIGEIRYGVERISNRGDAKQALMLERWLDHVIAEFSARILVFDEDCAQMWGRLMSLGNQNPINMQIASIGLINSLTIVTRNTRDFADSGVKLLNPFSLNSSACGRFAVIQTPAAIAPQPSALVLLSAAGRYRRD